MSALNTLNNVQQQVAGLNAHCTADKATAAASGSAAFGKALEIAMGSTTPTNIGAASSALSAGAGILEQQSTLSNAAELADFKSNIDSAFAELNTGIASTLVAALAGADSATAVTPETEETPASLSESLAEIVIAQNGLVSEQEIADAKKLIDSITTLLPNNKMSPLATAALASIDDTLLETEDGEEQTTS